MKRWSRVCVAGALVLGACGGEPQPEEDNPFGDDGAMASSGPADTGDTTTADTFGDSDPSTSTSTSSTTAPATSAATDDSGDSETGAVDTATTTGAETTTTASDTGTTTTAAGSDGNDTFNDGTLDVQVQLQNMWATGECDDVTVTNISNMQVTWEVDLDLPGTIYQLWNAELLGEMAGVGTFGGVDFNATLAPSESAMFGFCVDY